MSDDVADEEVTINGRTPTIAELLLCSTEELLAISIPRYAEMSAVKKVEMPPETVDRAPYERKKIDVRCIVCNTLFQTTTQRKRMTCSDECHKELVTRPKVVAQIA